MQRPYNPSANRCNCEQIGIILLCAIILMGLPACYRRPSIGAQSGPTERPTIEAVPEADRLYAGRADLANVRRAILELRRAQLSDAGSFDIAWRLSKYNYYLGSHSQDESEKEKAYRDGIEAAKLAVTIAETRPEGHFWLGANYGGAAETSVLTGLAEVDEIRQEMERVIELDEKLEGGSAYMVLGQTYLEAPALLGGDRQKAVELFEKGLRIDDGNAMLHYHLAEAYLSLNRKDAARRQIDKLFAMKPNPNYLPEYNDAVTLGRKLQDKLK